MAKAGARRTGSQVVGQTSERSVAEAKAARQAAKMRAVSEAVERGREEAAKRRGEEQEASSDLDELQHFTSWYKVAESYTDKAIAKSVSELEPLVPEGEKEAMQFSVKQARDAPLRQRKKILRSLRERLRTLEHAEGVPLWNADVAPVIGEYSSAQQSLLSTIDFDTHDFASSAEELWEAYDVDTNGVIDTDECLDMCRDMIIQFVETAMRGGCQSHQCDRETIASIDANAHTLCTLIFQSADVNHDGYLQREEFVPFFRGPNVATEYLHNQRMLAKRLLQAGEPASQTPKDIPFSDLLAHKLMNI